MASANKVIYFDPNDQDKNGDLAQVKLEDLSINVELTTDRFPRTVISTQNTTTINTITNSKGGGTINFIEGSKVDGTDKRTLTTSYTEIGTVFTKPSDNDLEGFGIETIDISFDTAYTPIVKIRFVDVRGGMLTRNVDSKYGVFFDLPYPTFNLTIKGFYGKTITYCLHLQKWNGAFNSNNGNFEIDAEFIGYTYAMLADLLIGFLKAAPRTKKGRTIFEDIKKDYANAGSGTTIGEILTIDEFIVRCAKLDEGISGLKRGDKDYEALLAIGDSDQHLSDLRKLTKDFVAAIAEKTPIFHKANLYFSAVKKTEHKGYYDDLVEKFKADADIKITEINRLTKKNLINPDQFKIIKEIRDVETSGFSRTNDYENIQYLSNKEINLSYAPEPPNYSSNNSLANDDYITLYKIGNSLRPLNITGTTFSIYDVSSSYNQIVEAFKINKQAKDEVGKKLTEKLKAETKKVLGIDPTIKSIFRVLTIQAEVLLKTLHELVIDIQNDKDNRTEVLSDLFGSRFTETVYPFPEYYEGGEEKWIGGANMNGSITEVDFVEEFVNALLDSGADDIKSNTLPSNSSLQWYPIGVFDTPLSGGITNPYKMDASVPFLNINEVFRVILYRYILQYESAFSGIAEKTLYPEMTKLRARFEAANAFYGIGEGNKVLLDAINAIDADSIIDGYLKGYSDVTNPDSTKGLKPMLTEISGHYMYTYITGSTSGQTSASNTRAYIPTTKDTYDGKIFYDWFNPNEVKSESGLAAVAQNSNTIFFSNFYNPSYASPDYTNDGATYVDIIKFSTYNNKISDNGLKPNFGKGIADDYAKYPIITSNIIQSKLINAIDDTPLEVVNPLGGAYAVQEFFKIKADDQSDVENINVTTDELADVSLIFFTNAPNNTRGSNLATKKDKSDSKAKINIERYEMLAPNYQYLLDSVDFLNYNSGTNGKLLENIDRYGTNILSFYGNYGKNRLHLATQDDITLPFIELTLNRMAISLFGSALYYAQGGSTNPIESKAYLFLNTFPISGIMGDKDGELFKDPKIKTLAGLFNNNGGFIKAPTMWVYWVGSILWRNAQINDPLVFTANTAQVGQQPNIIALIPGRDSSGNMVIPAKDELCHEKFNNNAPMCFGQPKNYATQPRYKKIDDVILKLPKQVKDKFINLFLNWAKSNDVYGFGGINKGLELMTTDVVVNSDGVNIYNWTNEIEQLYNVIIDDGDGDDIIRFQYDYFSQYNSEALKNYSHIIPLSNTKQGFGGNLFLENKEDSSVVKNIITLMSDSYVIMNQSYRTFRQNEVAASPRTPFRLNKDDLSTYIKNFLEQFKADYKEKFSGKAVTKDEASTNVFSSIDSESIKLNVYRTLGSIVNKWVLGTDSDRLFNKCKAKTSSAHKSPDTAIREFEGRFGVRLLDSFRFLNKSFNDIGDEFIINPKVVANILINNYNQSLYEVISRILADNNFNFIPLPTYINFNDEEELKTIFTPYSYKDQNYNGGPTFICVYAGQSSNHLDLGDGSEYPNDGLNLNPTDVQCDEGFSNEVKLGEGDLPVPVFTVNYAQQNQNYFKSIKLDQREFTETMEGLNIIDMISKSADKSAGVNVGQNLYNVYKTRSYSAEVEALGMPMIQPMMYFQLNNVPMFRGAYLIINTSHTIKPHYMSTTFKGVRVRDCATHIDTEEVVFMKLLGDTSDKSSDTQYNIPDKKDEPKKDNPIIDQKDATPRADGGSLYEYNFKKAQNKFCPDTNVNCIACNSSFDRLSNTKKGPNFMTYNQIFDEVSQITGVPVITLKTMSVIESSVGKNKGLNGTEINGSGYVGLMQFGRPGVVDVQGKINKVLFTTNGGLVGYTFGATIDTVNKKILIPPTANGGQWSKDSADNNKTTNSIFDDYINTLAAAFYAIQNVTSLNTYKVVDVYLKHQQGSSGINTILANPLGEPEKKECSPNDSLCKAENNAANNMPPDNEPIKNLRDWYIAWAGRVEGIAVCIDPTYKSTITSEPSAENSTTPNADKLRGVLRELGYTEKNQELTSNSNKDITSDIEKAADSLFRTIHAKYPALKLEVTSGNDKSHASSAYSRHKDGNAIDFVIRPNLVQMSNDDLYTVPRTFNSTGTVIINDIINILNGYCAGNNPNFRYLDEYRYPSNHLKTAPPDKLLKPHFHISWGDGSEGKNNLTAALAIANNPNRPSGFTVYTV